MADKTTHVAEVQFKAVGTKQIEQAFDSLKKLNLGKVMDLELEKVKSSVSKLSRDMIVQMNTGLLDPSKLDTEKIVKKFATFFQKLESMSTAGKLGQKTKGTFAAEIGELEKKLKAQNDKLSQSTQRVKEYKEQITKLREAYKGSGEGKINQKYLSASGVEKRTDFLQTRIEDPKTTEKTKQKYAAELSLLQQYAKKYNSINKQIAAETQKRTSANNQMTKINLELNAKRQQQFSSNTEVQELKDLNQVYQGLLKTLEKYNKVNSQKIATESKEDMKQSAKNLESLNKAEGRHNKTLGQKMLTGGAYYLVFNKIRQLYRDMIRTVTDLDQAMTTVAMVTSMNRKEAWALLSTYQNLSKEVGVATSELANLSVYFFRQGRSAKEAMELTEVAAKSAKVAGINVEEAANYLTSAVNGFGLAADQAEEVADKFAELSASSASSFEEIAIAMSKVAPVAQSAGISIDFMMGVIAKGIETTREAPENIGTAFKTVFARMRKVTDIGAADDGTSLNEVDRALESIGVSLRDTTGQFRNLEDVLIDVGMKFDSLNSIEKAYVATALAGTRQQSRLLAVFNDFDRTLELIDESGNSLGAMSVQHEEYMQGMSAALTGLKTAWEQLITTFASSEVLIGLFNGLSKTLSFMADSFSELGNAGQLTITLMTSFIGLIVLSKINIIKETIATIANTAKKIFSNTVRVVENNLVKKSVYLSYEEIAARKLATGALQAETTSRIALIPTLKASAKAAWASLGPYALMAAAIGAVVAIVWTSVKAYKNANKTLEDYNDSIKENNTLMYENADKADSIMDLAEAYEELNKKILKTNEDLDKMKSIMEEISNIETDDNISFVKIIGGVEYLDTQAIEEYYEDLQAQNEESLRENINTLQSSINSFGLEKTLESSEMNNTMRNYGYSLIESMITGIEDEELQDKVNKAMTESLFNLDYEKTETTKGSFKSSVIDGIFDTREELIEAVKEEKGWSDFGIDFRQSFVTDVIQFGDYEKIDEEALEDKLALMTSTVEEYYKKESHIAEKYSEDQKVYIQELLSLYKEQINDIRKSDLPEEVKTEIIASLSYAAEDAAILDTLINKQKIDLDVVIRAVELGSDYSDISSMYQDLFDNLGTMTSDEVKDYIRENGAGVYIRTQEDFQKLSDSLNHRALEPLLENMLTASPENVASTMDKVREYLVKNSEFTDEEIAEVIDNFSTLYTMNGEQITGLLTEYRNAGESLSTMMSNMSEGDFSDLNNMMNLFGADDIDSFIVGEKTILDLLKEQERTMKSELKIRIANLENQKERGELSSQEANELATLKLILKNNDLINAALITREYLYGKVEDKLDKISSLTSVIEKLSNAGIESGSIFDFFDKSLSQEKNNFNDSAAELMSQYAKDINSARQDLINSGILDSDFNFLGANTSEQSQAYENYTKLMNSFADVSAEYIDYIQDQYDGLTDSIEEMYDAEIEAIKDANDARWDAIDYASDLLEIEKEIVEARESLLGAELSGTSATAIASAQEDLASLRRERQEMIEEQMIAAAEKQLEAERDAKLAELQTQQIDAMSTLTDAINSLAKTMEKTTTPSSGGRVIKNLPTTKFPSGVFIDRLMKN